MNDLATKDLALESEASTADRAALEAKLALGLGRTHADEELPPDVMVALRVLAVWAVVILGIMLAAA